MLVWGIVDGAFQKHELDELIYPLVDSALDEGLTDFFNPDEVINELLALKWLVEIEQLDILVGYRSRMAETVRLLQRLRQLFPKHARQSNGWQAAPTLVADFRFHRRRRQYPKRDLPVQDVLARLTATTDDAAILTGIRALIQDGEGKTQLSGFQVRATERILRSVQSGQALATIVTAGTGSGKTLAFYLPALASITRHILAGDGLPWVKVVALYPRSELLKDQLREVIRRSESLRKALGEVFIRVGALYGDIPSDARWCNWPRLGKDYICPSLKCIHCNGAMIWNESDHAQASERLVCHDCHWTIKGDTFPLTRKSLAATPPDILFTTTEMLNQRLSDNYLNRLFGIGARANRPPELVLLDEVHTYEGRHGAQVGYLLRRWQHLVDQPLRFVGLSATLREAESFFSTLTGVRQTLVEEISPNRDELETEGAEYMVALRGDPVSRSALLSTTIQTCMLLQRCLDPKTADLAQSVGRGAFGQRTFVFTDDLDVTNRLYFDLLSAEGRTSRGIVDARRAPEGGLAVLRRSGTSSSRYRGGQDWRACEQIGHILSERLNIKRVSSQDRGVDPTADIIVATAALEVGFDDPSVGAVVQHKAPRGMAGFLQRKGRAGRTRGMRPWTVVVLSDYGRDRIAYQGYDLLFDPELPARSLPLSNRYITRMQAVFATLDYLGQALQDGFPGSVWQDLVAPKQNSRTPRLIKDVRSVLESDNGTRKLKTYISRALDLPESEVSAVLWEFPRPLMSTVLPTALRRLTSGWSAFGQAGSDLQTQNNPLPDFVPGTLFADLNLAEVRIDLPRQTGAEDDSGLRGMPVISALKEFAPGRVSRRFGVQYRTERYWISPPPAALRGEAVNELPIDEFGTYSPLGQFSYAYNGQVIHVPVFRPISLAPTTPDTNISDTSNGRLIWHSQFVPVSEPTWLEAPIGNAWIMRVPRLGFFTHARHSPVEVRRFATGATAEVGVGPGSRLTVHSEFRQAGQPVALGAVFPADGVLFEIQIPSSLLEITHEPSEKWRAIRTARFFDTAWRGEALADIASPFLREWLAHVFMSALTYEAIQTNSSIESASHRFSTGDATISLDEVLDILFQSQAHYPEDEAELVGQDRLRQNIDDLIGQPLVLAELENLARYLWEPITVEWETWLRRIYQGTIGAALLQTIGDLCPSVNLDDLTLDLDRGPNARPHLAVVAPGSVEVWITEKNPGGSGLIEEFMRQYAEDPRRFFSMVRASLEMGEFELIDHQLGKLLHCLTDANGSAETPKVVQRLRAATDFGSLAATLCDLRRVLLRDGFSPFHGFVVSIGNRILRSGTGPGTDHYLADVIKAWNSHEVRLGVEIDLRVICFWLSQRSDIDSIADEVGIPAGHDRQAWRMNAIYGLLWTRGRFIRSAPLQTRNPFFELPPIERLLVIDTVVDDRQRISVEDPQWLDTVQTLLSQGHLVTLSCTADKRHLLGAAIHALITNPIESGYLRAFARLQGVRQTKDLFEADFELLEAVQ
ncbi:MAG: protein DpdJ [Methylococcaceae bacterium]|nr:protein DpdJ [Methylococcaceae bacterium]